VILSNRKRPSSPAAASDDGFAVHPYRIPVTDDESVIIRVRGDRVDRRASFVPRSVRNLSPEVQPVWNRLTDAAEHVAAAQQALADAVTACRTVGLSWSSIGFALGVTEAGARKRYDDRPLVHRP
jgi:hypothetical protein